MKEVIKILTSEEPKDDNAYFSKLMDINCKCAEKLNIELYDYFRPALIKELENIKMNQKPINYNQFLEECQQRIASNEAKTNESNRDSPYKIIFRSIRVTTRLTVIVEIENSQNQFDFKDYSFFHVNSTTNGKFSAKPLQGEKIAELVHQPSQIHIFNSWYTGNGILVLLTVDNKLRLAFLPKSFEGMFTDHFIYETDVSDPTFCYGSYASSTNLLFLVVKASMDKKSRRFIR